MPTYQVEEYYLTVEIPNISAAQKSAVARYINEQLVSNWSFEDVGGDIEYMEVHGFETESEGVSMEEEILAIIASHP